MDPKVGVGDIKNSSEHLGSGLVPCFPHLCLWNLGVDSSASPPEHHSLLLVCWPPTFLLFKQTLCSPQVL